MEMMNPLLLLSLVFMTLVSDVLSSAGDRSYVYQRCLSDCMMSICSHVSDDQFNAKQPVPMKWLSWTCPDECQYGCMWKTVGAYQKDGSPIQQFHGKWPFIRMFGIQEPASTLFSLLNAISHLIMLIRLRKQVPSKAPMFYMWHLYALVAINAWLWAVIFHTRDFPFTEMMDYFCAISLVLSSFFIATVRILGPPNWMKWMPVGTAIASYFVYHVNYLTSVSFDYGYNMKANIVAGLLSSVAWVSWSLMVRQKQPYIWKAIATIFSLNLLIMLELGDFPPLWWTLDAHSLWHLGTAPIPFLWYSFVIDDCKFMLENDEADRCSSKSKGGEDTKSRQDVETSKKSS